MKAAALFAFLLFAACANQALTEPKTGIKILDNVWNRLFGEKKSTENNEVQPATPAVVESTTVNVDQTETKPKSRLSFLDNLLNRLFGKKKKHSLTLSGTTQSPIEISIPKCKKYSLSPLEMDGYWNNKANCTLTNNGKTASLGFDSNKPTLKGGPLEDEYIFEQIHFHWSNDNTHGCEHILDGKNYPAECHLVHYKAKYGSYENAQKHSDGLAVIGFFLESSDKENPLMNKFTEALAHITKPESTVTIPSKTLSWMDKDHFSGPYLTYKGSLTTPPYQQCVIWMVFVQPMTIGSEQFKLFQALEGSNYKPIRSNVRSTQKQPSDLSVIYVTQE